MKCAKDSRLEEARPEHFYDSGLSEIVLPRTLKKIGAYALQTP